MEWLANREGRSYFDWRYYLSRYEGARSSVGDGYFHNKAYDRDLGGFSYLRLRILYGGSYVSHFSDAFLRAAWVEGGLRTLPKSLAGSGKTTPGSSSRRPG